MSSSEDVLLQVNEVRYKKGDGTLYAMNERLAWILEGKDTVSVSHRYADIKTQKISPVGKPKIQLQVVLNDGTTSTFHFVNKLGPEAQIKDRDVVKELLQQQLPRYQAPARPINKELEEKNRLLSQNPSLLQLYKDLVITQVITADEFWVKHATKFMQKQKAQAQEIGVSGAFLADIKPQTDGCNGLKYNLTPDIIESIFKTYPAVRTKYMEHVPIKLSETEFWTKFFQSHYFHRDRINAGTKDLFTECAKLDDQELKQDINSGISDPLVDITGFEDTSLAEGYGITPDKPSSSGGNIVHQSMIKRFNQHSIMVLKACQEKEPTQSNGDGLQSNSGSTTSSDTSLKPPEEKRMRLIEKVTYEDLDSTSTVQSAPPLRLNFGQVEGYLQGSTPQSAYSTEAYHSSQADPKLRRDEFRKELSLWYTSHGGQSTLVRPAAAVSALGELTPGGELMKGFIAESQAQLVPSDLQLELRNLYISMCELLRHFYACFPPTNPQLEEKVVKMYEAINRFHATRLTPFEDRVRAEFSPIRHHLTSHLHQLIAAAYRRFDTWKMRQKTGRPLSLNKM
ncbi:general transcription factor IIH subunit 1 isoform X1 [Frankliniella occidentalis]|uniref:General transcription factor IIH subunit 1 isoform X1 n=2 Tax=Frankliniella occidentalis TaxID=133901 RepID=A0A6J1TFH9_FRAOC|nr:general transcription factor IIH subunit 1 isoform X1 [Frankliniella occidentalis]XP_052120991.1 general transcription factor IIH subunit 1 isoform X1 [Frankliniella occidentalis]